MLGFIAKPIHLTQKFRRFVMLRQEGHPIFSKLLLAEDTRRQERFDGAYELMEPAFPMRGLSGKTKCRKSAQSTPVQQGILPLAPIYLLDPLREPCRSH